MDNIIMNHMTPEEAKKLDEILEWLNKGKSPHVLMVKNGNVRKRCELLKAKGYIIIYEISGENPDARLGITDAGISFFKDGGFAKVVENETMYAVNMKLQQENLILTNNELKYKRSIRIWKSISLAKSNAIIIR